MRVHRELHCHACGRELTGGLDTYGDVGTEMCEECETALLSESEPQIKRGGQWQRLSEHLDLFQQEDFTRVLQGLIGKTLRAENEED